MAAPLFAEWWLDTAMMRDTGRAGARFRRQEISFSQGGKWKALISKYIGIIPLSCDACSAPKQRMADWVPPRMLVSSAMIAKVGAAAKHSPSATQRVAACSLSERFASPAHPLAKASLMWCLLPQSVNGALILEYIEEPLDRTNRRRCLATGADTYTLSAG